MEKSKKTVVSPQVSPQAAEYYRSHYKSVNAGAQIALEFYPELRKVALDQMRGTFSANELKMIIDLLNGTFLDQIWVRNNLLVPEVWDGSRLDGIDKKWDVSASKLVDKLGMLDLFQSWFLVEWAKNFWGKDNDIEKYVAAIAKESPAAKEG